MEWVSPVASALPPAKTASIPAHMASPRWPVPTLVFAAACITIGILWDISWHSTIGRDTFWTPAHLMIYLGGTLGGMIAGWLAFSATFLRRSTAGAHAISVLGAKAPLGAWVTLWGAAAMLTSAPLDDWWHNAYGLDVKILSPPHALLAAGMYGVVTGAVLLAAAARNRGGDSADVPAAGWVIVAMGIQLALASILLTEFSFPNRQHTAAFYLVSAAMYPTFLTAAARYAPVRWAATRVALVYMAILAMMVWILPLFAAEPGLAPVYNRVTHMTPPSFPLLLVIPALAIDLIFQAFPAQTPTGARGGGVTELTHPSAQQRPARGFGFIGGHRRWIKEGLRVLLAAALFVALFVPVQWFFSAFLISPAANNPLFAGNGRFLGYMAQLDQWRDHFWRVEQDPFTPMTLVRMSLLALVTCGLGSAAGTFLTRIRR